MLTYPQFVMDDSEKALRVRVRDKAGALIDLTTGTTRIYPIGQDNNDRPTDGAPGAGLLADVGPSIGLGIAQFAGLGARCDITDGGTLVRRAQLYAYQVEFTVTATGNVLISEGTKYFRVNQRLKDAP